MEENNKVIVFEKKEIILVFLLVLILIVTSFTIGVRLGKKISLDAAGVKPQDVKSVELKSSVEEDAEKTIAEDSDIPDEEKLKKLMDESKARLEGELEKFSQDDAPAKSIAAPESEVPSAMAGKFTIQLGSYNNLEEAKQFAEGFTVRGYNPIINEVKISGKGLWYRVSLGLFNTVDEAKKYIRDEQSLFAGQDHIITEIR